MLDRMLVSLSKILYRVSTLLISSGSLRGVRVASLGIHSLVKVIVEATNQVLIQPQVGSLDFLSASMELPSLVKFMILFEHPF